MSSPEETISYLRSINPSHITVNGINCRRHLESLIESGVSTDNILRLTNEIGLLVYKDLSDPAARVNRFHCEPHRVLNETEPELRVQFEPNDYGPTLAAIRACRAFLFKAALPLLRQAALSQHMIRGNEEFLAYLKRRNPELHRILLMLADERGRLCAAIPELDEKKQDFIAVHRVRPEYLRTHEEYLCYFRSFDTPEHWQDGTLPVLREIFRNTGFLQLNEGCTRDCFKICAAGPQSRKVLAVIPFQTLEWIFKTFTTELKEDGACLFYATDLTDYRDGDNTAVDVIKLYKQTIGDMPPVSIAFQDDDPQVVEFVYRLVIVEELPLGRLSTLVHGNKADSLDRFLDALRKRAAQDGKNVEEKHAIEITNAFKWGGKGDMNKIYGNAVKERTPEEKIGRIQISCKHTNVLTPAGFEAQVIYPYTKLFPFGVVRFPVQSNARGKIHFPQSKHIVGMVHPILMDPWGFITLVSRPHFIEATRNGTLLKFVSTENLSPALESTLRPLRAVGAITQRMNGFRNKRKKEGIPWAESEKAYLREELSNAISQFTSFFHRLDALVPKANAEELVFVSQHLDLFMIGYSVLCLYFTEISDDQQKESFSTEMTAWNEILKRINAILSPRQAELESVRKGMVERIIKESNGKVSRGRIEETAFGSPVDTFPKYMELPEILMADWDKRFIDMLTQNIEALEE